ncbi:hypothetical protein CkaCkLH20_05402 [Colletotrichum karsti]|uniref:Uncharacterized protein n=1 Tax=Colletotrichum karsti TaxID=1095194 RepID=A0A9P6I8K0_9PEZI|nr:uncharacterized protein CkaCkLH20_05402 [Colletotrichum karsti]KAF9877136.1 hypothetical protein CkaCkLH20_05402 [Colletotrichum karsti]
MISFLFLGNLFYSLAVVKTGGQTTYSSNIMSPQEDIDQISPEKPTPQEFHVSGILEKEDVYVDSYRSTLVAEILLYILSADFIGVTWGRFPNYKIRNYMTPKTTYMEIAPVIMTVAALIAVPVYWRRSRDVGAKWKRALAAMIARVWCGLCSPMGVLASLSLASWFV